MAHRSPVARERNRHAQLDHRRFSKLHASQYRAARAAHYRELRAQGPEGRTEALQASRAWLTSVREAYRSRWRRAMAKLPALIRADVLRAMAAAGR